MVLRIALAAIQGKQGEGEAMAVVESPTPGRFFGSREPEWWTALLPAAMPAG